MQLESGLLGQIEKQEEGSLMIHRRHNSVQDQSDVTEDSMRPFQDRPLPPMSSACLFSVKKMQSPRPPESKKPDSRINDCIAFQKLGFTIQYFGFKWLTSQNLLNTIMMVKSDVSVCLGYGWLLDEQWRYSVDVINIYNQLSLSTGNYSP